MSPATTSGMPGVIAEERIAILAAAGRRAFTVNGQGVSWEEVLAFARARGDLDEVARRLATGATLQATERNSPTTAERRDAARAFRYARGLLAAEELEDWLARWGLSAKGWVDWLDRTLRVDQSNNTLVGPSHDEEELASCLSELDPLSLWLDAICSGQLEASANALAGASAAWVEATGRPSRFAGPDELAAAWERHLGQVIPEDELEALVGRHANDWLTIDLEWAVFSGPDSANEAVACGRFDGECLAEVAGRTGTSWSSAVVLAEDLAAPVRSAAISAPIDTPVLVGASGAADTVIAVRDRKVAALDNLGVRERAKETARRRSSAALIERWIRWDERPARR